MIKEPSAEGLSLQILLHKDKVICTMLEPLGGLLRTDWQGGDCCGELVPDNQKEGIGWITLLRYTVE